MGQESNEKVFFGPHTIHPSGVLVDSTWVSYGTGIQWKKCFWSAQHPSWSVLVHFGPKLNTII
jgi:hypothetical protein